MTQALSRIIVATDLSARSDRAVARAFHIAQSQNLPVEVLMVLDDEMPEEMRAPLHEKATHQLETLCERLAEGAAFTVSVQEGDPTEVLSYAAQDKSCLLVMGPHRPRPFLDMLRETTMQRVVRYCPSPVLVVTGPVLARYERVLSLIDFNAAADHAFDLGATLAPDAPLHPFHTVHVPYTGMMETTGAVQMDMQQSLKEDAQARAKSWAAERCELAHRLKPFVVSLSAPDGLVREASASQSFDLITAGAHGPVGAGRSLLGSVATDLMRAPPCDVLIGR